MKTRVYYCKCSQELSLNGRQLKEHICKSRDKFEPYSIVSCLYSDLHKDDIFVSPTLFMNLHHSMLTDEKLDEIASAEVLRIERPSIKTTTRKIENQVTVILKEQAMLDDFINTYGGVLQITPVLANRLFLPDAYTGEVEAIEGELGHYRVLLRMPVVIDFNSCTYCGACISVCPEGCISDSFEIDLRVCDRCGRCIEHCPQRAIDLHRYGVSEILSPQVLIDDDLKVNLPDDKRGVHRLSNIKELFSNIGEYQVSELIRHIPSLCQYHRGFDSGCKRCLEVCPSEAVRKNDEGLYIEHFRCEGCGRCVSVCPTGAMQYLPFDDELFLEYMKTLRPSGFTLVLAKEEELKRFHFRNLKKHYRGVMFIEHPNPDAICATGLIELFSLGVKRVYIGGGKKDLGFVNSLVRELSGIGDFVVPLSDDLEPETVDIPFSASIKLESAPRHILLSTMVSALMKETGVSEIELKDTKDRFTDILCDRNSCSLCLACVNVCNAGAMRSSQEDFSLRFNPSHCVNCGLCVELCPEKVLSREGVQKIDEGFFQERVLAQDEPLYCRRCGKLFGNRRVYDEVVRRLNEAGLFQERGRFLHLCEDCRVIALFEETVGEE